MLNYREKYGEDPLPDERGCENLKTEASRIIKKYDLEDKIDHLVEYVYNVTSASMRIYFKRLYR